MTVVRTICTVIAPLALAALITAPKLVGADSGALSPSITGASLSADQVVDNLVRRNQERAQALLHSEATRVYHLVYRGFPGDREAEMTVEACWSSKPLRSQKIVMRESTDSSWSLHGRWANDR